MPKIPDKINVYIRNNWPGHKYAFAVPCDDDKYNETALDWASYNNVKPDIIRDIPNRFSQCKIIDYQNRKSSDVMKIQSQEGWIFDLRLESLLDIIIEKGIAPGGIILTDLYIVQDKGIKFIGYDTTLDKTLRAAEAAIKGKRLSLSPGDVYKNGKDQEFLYLGNREYYDFEIKSIQKNILIDPYSSLLNTTTKYKEADIQAYFDHSLTYGSWNDFIRKYSVYNNHRDSCYWIVPHLEVRKSEPSAISIVCTIDMNQLLDNYYLNWKMKMVANILYQFTYYKYDKQKWNTSYNGIQAKMTLDEAYFRYYMGTQALLTESQVNQLRSDSKKYVQQLVKKYGAV